jgi:hypothetical protein
VKRTELDTARLDLYIAQIPQRADSAVSKIAFLVEGMAKQIAPHDTYDLRQSINTKREGMGHYIVQDGVHYGIYQELGFHHYRSGAWIQNPFMIPSLESARPKFARQLKLELFR